MSQLLQTFGIRRDARRRRRVFLSLALPTVLGAWIACAPPAVAQETGFASPAEGYPGQETAAVLPEPAAAPAGDPPARVVRLGLLDGDVSVEPAAVNAFSPAEMNQVLTGGDRVYTDPGADADLQSGQIAVRLGGGSDLTVTAMTDALAQFGLAAGSAHLRSFALEPGTVLELDTPEAAVTVLQPGDVRVDVDPTAHTTTVALISGQVQVDGPGSSQVLSPGQRLRIHGGDPATGQAPFTESLADTSEDALDDLSEQRDTLYLSGADAESPYLNADTIGGQDLASYGSWDASDDGPVWFPVVTVDWVPYCHGHWRWVPPWGWTWVATEPWGFAPFHYGRWANINGRWGWIPGPIVVRPVYAPALVAFAGGARLSASLGYGTGGGIAAWFPLGPHEPYVPWYHGSILYRNRVNASNLYNPNAAEVRGFYNQRAVNIFGAGVSGRSYLNRSATVAVPAASLASGASVSATRLRVPVEALASAPVLAHPDVSPVRAIMAPGPAHVLPREIPGAASEGRASVAADASGPGRAPVLFHRAEPASPERTSFEQQRRAMQPSEHGHPVSTQDEEVPHGRPLVTGPPPRMAPRAEPAPVHAPPPAPAHAGSASSSPSSTSPHR